MLNATATAAGVCALASKNASRAGSLRVSRRAAASTATSLDALRGGDGRPGSRPVLRRRTQADLLPRADARRVLHRQVMAEAPDDPGRASRPRRMAESAAPLSAATGACSPRPGRRSPPSRGHDHARQAGCERDRRPAQQHRLDRRFAGERGEREGRSQHNPHHDEGHGEVRSAARLGHTRSLPVAGLPGRGRFSPWRQARIGAARRRASGLTLAP